jgi:hypothetical protein
MKSKPPEIINIQMRKSGDFQAFIPSNRGKTIPRLLRTSLPISRFIQTINIEIITIIAGNMLVKKEMM